MEEEKYALSVSIDQHHNEQHQEERDLQDILVSRLQRALPEVLEKE